MTIDWREYLTTTDPSIDLGEYMREQLEKFDELYERKLIVFVPAVGYPFHHVHVCRRDTGLCLHCDYRWPGADLVI